MWMRVPEQRGSEVWGDSVNTINEDFDGGMEETWVRIKQVMGHQGRQGDSHARAQSGKMVVASMGREKH